VVTGKLPSYVNLIKICLSRRSVVLTPDGSTKYVPTSSYNIFVWAILP